MNCSLIKPIRIKKQNEVHSKSGPAQFIVSLLPAFRVWGTYKRFPRSLSPIVRGRPEDGDERKTS